MEYAQIDTALIPSYFSTRRTTNGFIVQDLRHPRRGFHGDDSVRRAIDGEPDRLWYRCALRYRRVRPELGSIVGLGTMRAFTVSAIASVGSIPTPRSGFSHG